MKESILMRVLFCKIHCPLICFCKPSVAHLYTSEPLKLENSTPNIGPTDIAGSDSFDNKSCGEGKEECVNGNKEAIFVGKSCIKKLPAIVPESTEEIVKKRVRWIDNFGKELVQIKEFESRCIRPLNSSTQLFPEKTLQFDPVISFTKGDTDNEEENNRCLCVIL